jgi:hypothetical protein
VPATELSRSIVRFVLPAIETSGFASPPHDGFAIVSTPVIGRKCSGFSRSYEIPVVRSSNSSALPVGAYLHRLYEKLGVGRAAAGAEGMRRELIA